MRTFRREITKKGRVMTAPSPDSNLLSAGRGDAGFLIASSAGTVRQNTVVTELREAEQRLMKKFHPLRVRHRLPRRRNFLPTLPKQVLPHPLCLLSADVLTSFKASKNRRTPLFSTALHEFSIETAISAYVLLMCNCLVFCLNAYASDASLNGILYATDMRKGQS